MRDDPELTRLPPLDAALSLLCRLVAGLVGAPWAAVAPPHAGRVAWNVARGLAPPGLAVAALAGPDPAQGAVVTTEVDGAAWMAAAALPGTGGRLVVFGDAARRPDAAQRRDLLGAAGLAAARIAAEVAAPDAVRALARFGHFRLDRESGGVAWSPEAYRLYGYDPRDGAPSLAMALAAFPPRAQAELRAAIARSWESGEEASVAAAITRRDGARRDVLVRLRADPPTGNAPRATLSGILLDVTEARSFDERLQRERELLRTTLDHMDQGLFVVEPDMSVPVLSRRVTELLCLPEAFMESRPTFPEILNYQHESGAISLETLNSSINSFILNREELPEVHVYERETFDGKVLEVRTTRRPDGGFVRTFTDQTARRRRDAEIARAQGEYRLLFENAISGIYRADPDGRLLRANPAAARMNGYDSEAEFLAALGDDAADWYVDQGRRDEFRSLLQAQGRVTDFVSEGYRHRTRERVWLSETAWVIRDAAGAIVGYEGTLIDATERKRAEGRIAHMARHDALTGLPNRLSFAERLETALAAPGSGEPLAVMLFDLDRLKAVNDTLGHPAGDALLAVLGARIATLLGPEDVVARFGGDEFALLAPGAGAVAAAALAERVLAAVRAPAPLGGREITVSASIGIALAPRDGRDPTALLRSADMALYRAKAEGRDTWRFFAAAMDAEVQDRQRLEIDLRAALEHGEFCLAYQPVIAVAGGAPVGYEALLRWTHPERGPIEPATFIAIAEESRLIGAIGAWALARACADAAAWPQRLGLWVNVSAVQLAQPEFEAVLEAALTASGVAPGRLVLEITETALMHGRVDLAPRLARLRARGLRTALDDFGTGYSSLAYLRRFAFDVIKIDRSFVQSLAEPDAAAIVASVLDLGGRLGLATVAEGVETEAQLAALRHAGCGFVQGRLFGPPVESATIAETTPAPRARLQGSPDPSSGRDARRRRS